MIEPLTITNEPLESGMDYARLRAEGQQLIAGLAGHVWTDYNPTDPGITLLETLCYAITDLSYRLGFDVQDLLASSPDGSSSGKQFFSAREILTVNPLTIMDYRKLLIDIKGVRNAWLEKAEAAETPVVYDQASASISFPFTGAVSGQQPGLNGLYRVLLELDGSDSDQRVINNVWKRMRKFRNVGEDIAQVHVLGDAEVTIKADIEIDRNADVNEVLAGVYERLHGYLSPRPAFHTLESRLESGREVEEIFNGPPLDNGFLDDGELESFQRITEIFTADIVTVLMQVERVTAVRNVLLSQGRQTPVEWVLKLRDPVNSRPVLKPVGQFLSDGDITLYSHDGANIVSPDNDVVVSKVERRQERERKAADTRVVSADLEVPGGQHRDLTDFVSMQAELPINFGVGRHGLSGSADDLRRAQAKQLQAYLLVFDQLMLNYLAQLANARELFAVKPDKEIAATDMPSPTYFAAPLPAQVAGAEDVIANYDAGYHAWLDELVADPEVDADRMNRFLDHLLARHGQDFTPGGALYPIEETGASGEPVPATVRVIPAKRRFLQDCAELSRNRAKGFNYTDGNTWDTDNVSGLEKRIKRLLDIGSDERHSLQGVEGFHLIDHILLRPVLPNGHVTFQGADVPDKVLCAGRRKHGLQDQDEVGFMQTPGGNYLQSVYPVEVVDEYDFLIPDTYVAPADPNIPETGIWIAGLQKQDSLISLSRAISRIGEGAQLLDETHHTTAITAPGLHGLDTGDTIFISGSRADALNGVHKVRCDTPGCLEIDVPFKPAFKKQNKHARINRHPLYPDPYSCRLSFIFPAAGARAAAVTVGQRFRDLVAEVIRKETPAHITPHLYWLEDKMLKKFEVDYKAWLQAKAAARTNSQKIRTAIAANKLLGWLV